MDRDLIKAFLPCGDMTHGTVCVFFSAAAVIITDNIKSLLRHFIIPREKGYCFRFVCLSVCLSVRDAFFLVLCA